MPWSARFVADAGYVELTYTGSISPADLRAALAAAVSLGRDCGTARYLADCSGMVGGHSVIDLYDLIALFEQSGLPRHMKEALLLPALRSTAAEVGFYETACRNRGYNVRVFSQAEAALAWLTADP